MVLDKLKINPGILALENPNQFLTVPKALVLIALISGKTFYYIFSHTDLQSYINKFSY